MMFWGFAKVYGMRERIVPPDPWFRSLMSVVTLEAGLIVGAVLLLGEPNCRLRLQHLGVPNGLVRCHTRTPCGWVIPSSTAILLGFQIIYSAFFV